jgi:ABC transporter substrate binding protein
MIGGGTWEGAPMFDMRRREFITLLGGAAVGWPLAARAQQTTMPVIGFLNGASPGEWTRFLTAFRGGLRESGFTEGQNVAIEFRWAEGRYDRLPALAADLVNRRVAVLVATAGTTTAVAAKAATSTIPTVFSTGGDPVKEGLVASISRPGGNRTGVSVLTTALAPKRLEILREVVPKASVIGVLLNPNNASTQPQLEDVEKAARVIDQQVRILRASSETRFRAGVCYHGTNAYRRADSWRRSILWQQTRSARRFGCAQSYSGNLRVARICRSGWIDELRQRPGRWLSPGRHLYRADSQG